eukprot:2226679-Prymnesium_polylepis.1
MGTRWARRSPASGCAGPNSARADMRPGISYSARRAHSGGTQAEATRARYASGGHTVALRRRRARPRRCQQAEGTHARPPHLGQRHVGHLEVTRRLDRLERRQLGVERSDARQLLALEQLERRAAARRDESHLVLHVELGRRGRGVAAADDALVARGRRLGDRLEHRLCRAVAPGPWVGRCGGCAGGARNGTQVGAVAEARSRGGRRRGGPLV